MQLAGPTLLHAARWRAVTTRDAAADGTFVYAVKTTGVYCRPTCAARRPQPQNVLFFGGAGDAARAGFRACRRCHPDRASSPRDDALDRIRASIRAIESAESPPTLAALAAAAGLSRFHFQRLFKRTIGVSPREYYAARRRDRLQRALRAGESVDAAVYGAGYGSPSRVYEHARSLLGMSPAAYRGGAPGERIGRAFARSSLGWVGIAATGRGVCAIEIAGTRDAAAHALASRFPRATPDADAGALERWLAAAVAFVERPDAPLRLPLDVRGTAFQQRVWRVLQATAPGETLSYRALARRVGLPRGARAVARACATNPVPLAIPCHRVVPSGGTTGGYRFGAARKRALLERERSAATATRPARMRGAAG
jgi:AraC family transcriptional regulator, regulatory protein of adaptative response / methylated-DNA-[protein]-cysteine methyltransferase